MGQSSSPGPQTQSTAHSQTVGPVAVLRRGAGRRAPQCTAAVGVVTVSGAAVTLKYSISNMYTVFLKE